MLQRLHKRLRREEGFTLIELLVVILIIGTLAAIAIPSFLNQRGKGEDATAKSAARTAQTAMETFYTDNNTYACGNSAACVTALTAIEPQLPAGDLTVSNTGGGATNPTATSYRVTIVSQPSGRTFSIDKNGGTVQRVCVVPAGQNPGGCDGGTW